MIFSRQLHFYLSTVRAVLGLGLAGAPRQHKGQDNRYLIKFKYRANRGGGLDHQMSGNPPTGEGHSFDHSGLVSCSIWFLTSVSSRGLMSTAAFFVSSLG